MKAKINISEILKDKPKGIRLYSPIFGDCTFSFIQGVTDAICVTANDNREFFDYKGLYSSTGECQLFPSKEMRDWSKFSWKRGNVLQHSEYPLTVIFESFEDDTYTSFKCKYCFNFESASKWLVSNRQCSTKHFYKVSEEEAKEFIEKVELNYNGKLNMETLKIEPVQPKFKDGDMVSLEIRYIDSEDVIVETYIVHGDYNYGEELNFYTGCNNLGMIKHNSCVKPTNTSVRKVFMRYATDFEKQQLFLFLAKKGKAWDAEKKEIVVLKPKVELKPFDKVLVRDYKNQAWTISFFGFKDASLYFCSNGCSYQLCIPYEGNEHLLGTTKDVEG